MKVVAYDVRNKPIELEVYKVQIALFGGPSCLIYNETRDETYETHDKKEVERIQKFIEKKTKAFVAGQYNKKNGKIILMHLLEEKNLF